MTCRPWILTILKSKMYHRPSLGAHNLISGDQGGLIFTITVITNLKLCPHHLIPVNLIQRMHGTHSTSKGNFRELRTLHVNVALASVSYNSLLKSWHVWLTQAQDRYLIFFGLSFFSSLSALASPEEESPTVVSGLERKDKLNILECIFLTLLRQVLHDCIKFL